MKGTLKIEDHSAMPEDHVLPEKHGRSSVKGEIVSAGFVTDDYQCLSELIATVKGETVDACL